TTVQPPDFETGLPIELFEKKRLRIRSTSLEEILEGSSNKQRKE
ncbi:8623_t:CDS:1, partial [Cetraspora pellucida]